MYIVVALVSGSGSMQSARERRCVLAALRLSVSAVSPSILGHCCVCVQAASEDVCLWDEEATSQSQSGKRDETVRATLMFYRIQLGMRINHPHFHLYI